MTRTRLWGGCVLLVILALLTHTVHAQSPDAAPSAVYLPVVRKSSPPATFALRVARVDRNRAGNACLNPLTPAAVAASPVQICPVEGDYISLVASNPSGLAIGGRNGDGEEAAWSGNVGDFDLLSPTQTIVADHIELQVGGYLEATGFYTAPAGGYTVIQLSGAGATADVAAAQTGGYFNEMDFAGKLQQMLDQGSNFDIDFPGNVRFYDQYATSSKRPFDCGNATHAVWSPLRRITWLRSPTGSWFVMMWGEFHDEQLAQCMGEYRWVKIADIMLLPAAAHVKTAVDNARGGAPATFQWIEDGTGVVYAAWTLATGTVAYYGYQALNSAIPTPATFLFIPNALIDVTCVTVQGIKSCLVTEGQPNQ